MSGDVAAAIAHTYREEWARIVAGLARRFGDLDIAEEMAAEAFATAVARWPADGVPPNPGAWLAVTAGRKAIDRLRRETRRDELHREALAVADDSPPEEVGAVEDDRLRLIFTCCHPALAMESRVALTLRIVGGLTVAEIARAFLVAQTTMAQRITRAKAKVRLAGIPFRVPGPSEVQERSAGVLAVIYLIFNEGYLTAGSGGDPLRPDLTGEAIRLARLVRELLPPGDTWREATGLLALMVLTEARADARLTADGALIGLEDQDRTAWDRALIEEGLSLVRDAGADAARTAQAPGRYQLLSAINAVHVSAPRARETDWDRIVALYGDLERLGPSPVVTLAKAVAVSEADSPEAAMAIVEPLAPTLRDHHAFHTTRAELLRRMGRPGEARLAYDRALDLADNPAEVAYLTRRRGSLAASTIGESE